MKKKLFKLTMLFAFVFAICAYADADDNFLGEGSSLVVQSDSCGTCDTCDPCDPCEPCPPSCKEVPKTGEPCNCAYNAPARIDPACGWQVWLTGSFIYWQAKERGLELGYAYTITEGIMRNYVKIDMSFDHKPGFKVGFGFSGGNDDWTLYLEYTRFISSNSRSYTNDTGVTQYFNYWWFLAWYQNTIGSGPSGASNLWIYADARWKLTYNIFDLELGRPYYVGKKVIFKPHFGVRGGWIDQTYKASATRVASASYMIITAKDDIDSWAVGPRVGVDTDWLIGWNFKLLGNVAASLLYQDFSAKLRIDNDVNAPLSSTPSTVQVYESFSYLTPNVEFFVGMGYGDYFCNNEWHFDIDVGYDMHYFWNQNYIRHMHRNVYGDLNDSTDLMMHGLTVTLRLDF